MKSGGITCAILVLAASPALCGDRSADPCVMTPVPGAMMTPAGPVATNDAAHGPRAVLARQVHPAGPCSTPGSPRMSLLVMRFTCGRPVV